MSSAEPTDHEISSEDLAGIRIIQASKDSITFMKAATLRNTLATQGASSSSTRCTTTPSVA
eukprot:4355188-Pyramimonas_sp.AAC.1